jgi:bud site selection protein 20
MGGAYAKKAGSRSKIKKYKRGVWLCNRDKDVDQIQDEFEKAQETGKSITAVKYDDELPGGGQFYCAETAKHFIDAKSLADHKKTKFFKRRIKHLKEEKYTQATAEWGSGLTKEKLPPAHPKKEVGA